MNEKVNLDYTLNGDYAVSSSTQKIIRMWAGD